MIGVKLRETEYGHSEGKLVNSCETEIANLYQKLHEKSKLHSKLIAELNQ